MMSLPRPSQGELHVRDFLAKLNLVQYSDRFIMEGFDQLPSLYEVTEYDLATMDVKRGHRRLIQREISNAKGIPQSSPLVISAPHKEDLGALPPTVLFDIPTSSQTSMSGGSRTSISPKQCRLNDRTMTAFFSSPYFPYTAESGGASSRVGGSTSSSSGNGQHSSMSTGRDMSMTGSGGTSTSTRNSSISSAEDDNGISDTSVVDHPHKRKYRRHAKPDKNAPIKPPSAYVMFSNKVRAELKNQNMSFTDLAKIVGDRWKTISPQEKEDYEMTAARAKEDYQDSLLNYEQTHDYKAYQQYMAEFKAKQEAAGRASGKTRKRAKTESPGSGSVADSSGNGHSSPNSHSLKGHNSSGDHCMINSTSTSAFSAFDPSYKSSSSQYQHHQQPHPFHHPTRSPVSTSSTSSHPSHLPPHHYSGLHHHSSSQSYPPPQQYYSSPAGSASSGSLSASSQPESTALMASTSSPSQMQSTASDSGGYRYSRSPPTPLQPRRDSPPSPLPQQQQQSSSAPLGEAPPSNAAEDAR